MAPLCRLQSTVLGLIVAIVSFCGDAFGAERQLVRSVGDGRWSDASTWEGSRVPGAGDRVQIRAGHRVVYDVESNAAIRLVHVAGVLEFDPDRNTRLDVGLIKIQAGDDASEDGFDCDAHLPATQQGSRPALQVGSQIHPIRADRTALIRLIECENVDQNSWPAIVCCGGRMDFHGTPFNRTWTKLNSTASPGALTLALDDEVTGWRAGDRIIVTSTKERRSGEYARESSQTEERIIRAIALEGSGVKRTALTLDRPLEYEHFAEGDFRAEVANLSRNVIVESANPDKARGHTMYHRGSRGSIGYAEFRHLGKQDVLGRYSLHFHLVGNTMRGSSVIGASIWDSGNRWLTIHGTNFLVVRDCVGYRSVGHGFFLEDGTEVYNVLDRNLAVGAIAGKPLKDQVLPYDRNEGAGFWWANSLNTFTRNVSSDNQEYGYRFDARQTPEFDPELNVRQPDGGVRLVDIRTLPFVRFEDNESHSDGLYGINLGEGADFVGSDEKHPFVVRNMKIWATHYAFRLQTPVALLDTVRIHRCRYGMYFLDPGRHDFRNLVISQTPDEPWSSSHSDESVQRGVMTVDGLVLKDIRSTYNILLPLTHRNESGSATSHFRNLRIANWTGGDQRALINLYDDPTLKAGQPGVPIYVHDYFGSGRHAKFVSTQASNLLGDGSDYHEVLHVTGTRSRVAEVANVAFPQPLQPVDDLPPATVITRMRQRDDGRWEIYGTASDNGAVARVVVNGQNATSISPNFAEWTVVLEPEQVASRQFTASAEDAQGLVEPVPHVVKRD